MSINIRFMVYNAFGIGGTVKTIFNFADYFQKTGKYNVEVLSIKKTKDTPTLHLNPKVKISYIQDARRGVKYSEDDKILLDQPSKLIHTEEDLYKMFNAYTDRRLKEWMKGIHDGILVTTMPSLNFLSTIFVDEKVLKVGQEHKSFADHTFGLQELIRNNYCKLDVLTILTERNKHIYERKMKGSIPVYVLGNGTKRLPFRADLKNKTIIAAGRYADQKGYDMLIKAFALIASEFPEWIVKIYGEGELLYEYIKLIQYYGLEDQIFLEPGSDCMDEKLSEAAIHVCSSYYEPFGMVIIEGFAMGLPCISFACDGPCEIITDGYDGLIVPKEDIDALASAMARVMSDEEYRLSLGRNAYETSKRYDIGVIGAKFMGIVEKEMKSKSIEVKEGERNIESEIKNVNSVLAYEQMIAGASNGKIGMKTIWKMFEGWINYKIRKKCF